MLPTCITSNHWLSPVIRTPSPHRSPRNKHDIDLLVLHNISLPPGKFGTNSVQDFFCGKLDINADKYYATIANMRVSAHLFITRTGDIYQFVPFSLAAWHAGISSFLGRNNCNEYSVGIELEGTDELPFTNEQYQSLKRISFLLLNNYSITKERIVGHKDIAPKRKTDPGEFFDWRYYYSLLNETSSQPIAEKQEK